MLIDFKNIKLEANVLSSIVKSRKLLVYPYNSPGLFGAMSIKEMTLLNFDLLADEVDFCGLFSNVSANKISIQGSTKSTSITDMFHASTTTGLAHVDLSQFKMENVENMGSVFLKQYTLESVVLSDTPKLTKANLMFSGCSFLKTVKFGNTDMHDIIDMHGMFNACSSLEELDLSRFYCDRIYDTICTFSRCPSLTTLDLSNFDIHANKKNNDKMFKDCGSLREVTLSKGDAGRRIIEAMRRDGVDTDSIIFNYVD